MSVNRIVSLAGTVAIAACVMTSCKKATGSGSGSGSKPGTVIAVISKGTTHSFWKSVERGAKAAAKDNGVDIVWKGPMIENDRAGQIGLFQQFVSEGVAGIVLAPLDSHALVDPVKSAMDKKIPVVIFDSGLEGTPGVDFASFVATDNYAGGLEGGRYLAQLMKNKGNAVLLRYIEGSASTTEREQGFLDAMKENPNITVISSEQYGGATSSLAKDKAMQMLDKLNEADGVFCPNESTTHGMLLALRDSGLTETKTKFVGFDAADVLIDALKSGAIHGLVAQNPYKMGYTGVDTMVKVLNNQKVEARIDTGFKLITKSNMNTSEARAFLKGNQ